MPLAPVEIVVKAVVSPIDVPAALVKAASNVIVEPSISVILLASLLYRKSLPTSKPVVELHVYFLLALSATTVIVVVTGLLLLSILPAPSA